MMPVLWKQLNCQQCQEPMDINTAKVEWMSTCVGIHLVETIRIVHPHCQYQFSKSRTLHMLDLYDHWLPLITLGQYMDIPDEKEWDNKTVAMAIFTDLIYHKNLHLKRGTQDENNKP